MEGQPGTLSWEEGELRAGKGKVKKICAKLGESGQSLIKEGSRQSLRKKVRKERRDRQGDSNRAGNVTTWETSQ